MDGKRDRCSSRGLDGGRASPRRGAWSVVSPVERRSTAGEICPPPGECPGIWAVLPFQADTPFLT